MLSRRAMLLLNRGASTHASVTHSPVSPSSRTPHSSAPYRPPLCPDVSNQPHFFLKLLLCQGGPTVARRRTLGPSANINWAFPTSSSGPPAAGALGKRSPPHPAPTLSGWYFLANSRYARLMSGTAASLSTPWGGGRARESVGRANVGWGQEAGMGRGQRHSS